VAIVSIQRGFSSLTESPDNVAVHALSSVTLANTVVFWQLRADSYNPRARAAIVRLTDVDELTVEIFGASGVDTTIQWWVVEFDDVTVQAAVYAASGSNTSQTETISTVDLDESFPISSNISSLTSWSYGEGIRVLLPSTTQIRWRAAWFLDGRNLSYQVVSWPGASVQHALLGLNDASTDSDTASITAVDLDRTFVISSSYIEAAVGVTAGSDVPLVSFDDTDTIRIQRPSGGSTAFYDDGSEKGWGAEIVELPTGYTVQYISGTIANGDLSEDVSITAVDPDSVVIGAGLWSWASGHSSSGDAGDSWSTATLFDTDTLRVERDSSGTDASYAFFVISQDSADLVVEPNGIAQGTALGDPSVALDLSPGSISQSIALGSPSVVLDLSPSSITQGVVLGDPSVALDLSPGSIAQGTALGSPSVSLALSPDSIGQGIALGNPGVSLEISPEGIGQGTALGSPSISLDISPASIVQGIGLGSPSIAAGLNISPDSIGQGIVLGSPSAGLSVSPNSIVQSINLGEPTVVGPGGISLGSIQIQIVLGSPEVSAQVAFSSQQNNELPRRPNLLVRALQPLPKSMTEARGIHQSDVIMRTALVMAIADLRARPWLLEYVFASLIDDLETAHIYGEKERQKAKEWFLNTDIPVVMDYRMDDIEGTCISISLVESSEAEVTLADVHYIPTEETEAVWPPLTSEFTPTSYYATTGIIGIPTEIGDGLVISPGMVLVDSSGKHHEILGVSDRYTIQIAPTVANFTSSLIKSSKPRLITSIESVSMRESYRIGCHAHGEPFFLTWLHAIVVFILLKYKEALLEARGFERSTISSAPFSKNEAFGQENVWTRFITINGYVRQYWPKASGERILSVGADGGIKYSRTGELAEVFVPQDGFEDGEAPWMSQDGVGIIVK
jgi:hypothetical protein